MKHNDILLSLLILIFCLNLSQESTEQPSTEPALNCQGTLIKDNGTQLRVKNILIGGLYDHIEVYGKPIVAYINPQTDKKEISLRDIRMIEFPLWERPAFVEFDKREYVEIVITFKSNIQQPYLVEKSREIWFADKNGAAGKERIRFERMRSLTIDRCMPRSDEECPLTDLDITQTRELIGELEATAQQLPEDTSTLGKIKKQLLELVDNLKQAFKNFLS